MAASTQFSLKMPVLSVCHVEQILADKMPLRMAAFVLLQKQTQRRCVCVYLHEDMLTSGVLRAGHTIISMIKMAELAVAMVALLVMLPNTSFLTLAHKRGMRLSKIMFRPPIG